MSSKLPLKAAAEILGELLAIYIAIRIGEISGIASGLLVFVTASWLFYKATSYERLWSLLGMLKDPAMAFPVYFSAATVYFGLEGQPLLNIFFASLGIGLVGSAVALLLDGYWEIGG
jgi:fucose permease